MPALQGKGDWPRHEFIYWTDDGSVAALRYKDWKITFLMQDAHGYHVWQSPFTALRAPMLANLRMDPFERAHDESIGYPRWWVDHMFIFAPAGAYVGNWLQSFEEASACRAIAVSDDRFAIGSCRSTIGRVKSEIEFKRKEINSTTYKNFKGA